MLEGLKHTFKTGEPTEQFMWFILGWAIWGLVSGVIIILN